MESIETKSLLLRQWQENDATDLYKMCLDQVLRKSGISTYSNIDECVRVVDFYKNHEDMRAIICKEDNCFIGYVNLGDMNRYPLYKELEYAVSTAYRNKGYATEAVKGLVTFAFKHTNVSVIAAWVRSHNNASIRVLEKCFFFHEGTLRKHARDMSDTLCYSILKEEFKY